MTKLIVSVVALAAFGAGGVAIAQGADSQAGSAWNNNGVDYGPRPGTAEYYGNSGWPPVNQIQASNDRRYYAPNGRAYRSARDYYASRSTPRDRDGDGVSNRRDRYPDDPARW
ncbi:MAG: hypothetical protein H7255_00805 [Ramlibacter sp.]|nr:hypothetical protein [Ramlibacter sp.]